MYSKLGRKLTNEEFDNKICDSNFIRLDDYIDSKTPIRFSCKICNKIFTKKPKDFNKLICKCELRKKDYIEFLKNNKNIELIGEYKNIREKTKHKCLKCGLIFLSSPKSVKNSINGCPSCSGKKFSIDYYKSILPNDIILLDDIYNSSSQKLNHKCLVCNKEWKTKPNYILHMKCGCPFCSSSKGEKEISNILDNMCVFYESQKNININSINYKFDFYIEEINLFIEYDGIQHFEPVEYFGGDNQFEIIKSNDNIKNNWIISNNYNLLRISYKDDIFLKILEFFENI